MGTRDYGLSERIGTHCTNAGPNGTHDVLIQGALAGKGLKAVCIS